MDFGYYRVDTVQRGKHAEKVREWTNLAYVGAVDAGFSENTPEERYLKLKGILRRITNTNMRVMLDVEMNAGRLPFGKALKAARPFWDKVKYIILDDELEPSQWDAQKDLDKLKRKMDLLQLPPKPIGATFTPQQVLGTSPRWFKKFDFVNIEAYHDLHKQDDPVAQIVHSVTMQAANLAPTPLSIVMQAYDRNGAFKNLSKMVEIQHATYTLAAQVEAKALVMFAYGRDGGTITYPQLAEAHREIYQKIMV